MLQFTVHLKSFQAVKVVRSFFYLIHWNCAFYNLPLNLGRTVSLAPTVACPGSMLLQIPVIVLYLRTLSGAFGSFKLLIWFLQKFLPLDAGVTQSIKVSPKLVIWPKEEWIISKKYLNHLKSFKGLIRI